MLLVAKWAHQLRLMRVTTRPRLKMNYILREPRIGTRREGSQSIEGLHETKELPVGAILVKRKQQKQDADVTDILV